MKLLLVALPALLGGASPGLASTSLQARGSCVAGDSEPFANFGTRSPYEVSGANLNSTPVGLEGCKPVHLWHLARHGTRHARQSSIESVRRRLPAIRDQIASWKASGRSIGLCDADLENILKWLPSVNASQEYQLTAQGQRDILNMGKRFRARFPGMFEGNSAANFKFRYDNTQRCIESSRWFYKGIFGEFPAQGEGRLDSLPDFYNRCPAYLIPIASDFITGDFNKFRKKSDWSEMVSRVSSRLGSYRNFDVDDIDAMYDACSYERSNNWDQGKLSPWCAAFRAEDFEVLEYWQDMREYYRTGYGHKTHAKLGCVPIKDLVKTFSERIAGKSGQSNDLPSGIIYHSHDTLINQVIAFLDLYHDKEKLRADNFNQQRNRSWRVTHFSPFASNLAAVLHECSGTKRYRVQLFLNENLLPLSDWGCDADSCTWAQFMGKFGHVLSDCKQRRLCLGL